MLRPVLQCLECGAAIHGSASLGLCAACVLQGAIEMSGERGGTAESPVTQLGQYELLEELGRGGMGVVYRARQRSLNRVVALKLLLGGAFAGTEGKRRLRAEAEAAARLRHPNIVAVHEAGEADGQPFFAMELVPGRTLADLVRQGPIAPARAARYVQKIARAVHHAHQQSVLHRDLKPSNVIIDPDDEPRVTDFGLAKILSTADGAAEALTLSGHVLGSPAYMSPEQAFGGHEVTAASDIYSLGAVLYELLTGRPPFQGASPNTVLDQVKLQEPVSPRRLNGSVPADLENVCLKCLEKEPRARYGSALELADELDRFLRHEPVRARPISNFEKSWRWARRHRSVAAAIAASVLALVAIAAASIVTTVRVSRANALERRARIEATDRLADALLSEAHALRLGAVPGSRAAALERITEAKRIDSTGRLTDKLRREAIAALTRPDVRMVPMAAAPRIQDPMLCAFSSSFEWCVQYGHAGVFPVIRVADGQTITRLNIGRPLPDEVLHVTDDARFVLLRYRRAVRLFDVARNRPVFADTEQRRPGALSADARWFARVESNAVAFYATATLTNGAPVAAHRWPVPDARELESITFAHTNLVLGSASALQSRDVFSGTVVWTRELAGRPWRAAFDPQQRLLAVAQEEDRVAVLSVASGETLREINTRTDATTTMAFTPAGDRIAIGTVSEGVRFFETRTGRTLLAAPWISWHLQFDPTGQRLATFLHGGQPGWLEWLPSMAVETLPEASFSEVEPGLQFSPNGEKLLALGSEGVLVWDLPARQLTTTLKYRHPVFATLSSNDEVLATTKPELHAFSLTNASRSEKVVGDGRWLWGIATAPEGLVAVADYDSDHVSVLDRNKRQVLARLRIERPERTTFSHSTRWLAAGAYHSRYALVWDWRTSNTVARLEPAAHCVEFSPDDRFLLTSGRRIELWQTTDWTTVPLPLENAGRATFSRDGRWLAATQHDREIHLIEVATRRTLAVLEPPGDGPIRSLAFHPNNDVLAICRSQEVQLWNLPTLRRELANLGLNW